jgi:hypothetical protein
VTRMLLIAFLHAVSPLGIPGQTTAFVDVNVVRLAEGDVLPSRTVVVTDGRVTAVVSADSSSPPARGVTIDGVGRYLVPGLVVLDASLPSENWLEWREALLVYLAQGVTTLGVSEAGIAVLERARAQGRDVGYRPVLARRSPPGSSRSGADPVQAASYVSGLSLPSQVRDPLAALRRHALDLSRSPIGAARIEPGAPADLLLLAEDPLRDLSAISRPVGVMVEGRWIPHADLEAVARAYGRDRLLWYGARLPRVEHPRGPWPASCVGETLDDCFGGDAECGFQGILGMAWWMVDCGAPSARDDRRALLDALDRLALVDPSDNWLVEQRVNFALMSGDPDRAWAAAERCASATWWCQALRGLVLHEWAPGSAHARFDSAYANAPDDTPAWSSPTISGAGDRGLHCEWTDLTYLIEDPDLLAFYHAEECGSNTTFEARFWWLADPHWSQPGNERRDEHIARNIRMRIRDDYLRLANRNHAHCISSRIRASGKAEPDDCAHGHGAIMRFGMPNSWRGAPYHQENGVRIGATGRLANPEPGGGVETFNGYAPNRTYAQLRIGFLNGGYGFVPDAARFLAPMESAASDWAVTWNEGHERMLTREAWHNLDHQTAVLRRGAEIRLLAAARFPEPVFSEGIEGFLAAGRVTDRHVEVVPATVDSRTAIMRASTTLPDDAWLASIEALGAGIRGRARHGAPAPPLIGGYGISDPVLVRPDFDVDRGDLLQAMLPSKTAQNQRVGLYFEIYGVEPGQVVEITLSHDALEGRPSLLRRIASALGIGRATDRTVRLDWTERITNVEDGTAVGFVALDLHDFSSGDHRITLSASVGDRTATGATDIHIRR